MFRFVAALGVGLGLLTVLFVSPISANEPPTIEVPVFIVPGARSEAPALVGQAVTVYLNVTDPDSPMVNISLYWDYLTAAFLPNPHSPSDNQTLALAWDGGNATWRGQAVFHHTYDAIGPYAQQNRSGNASGTLDLGGYFLNIIPDDGRCGGSCNPANVTWNTLTLAWVGLPLGNQPPWVFSSWNSVVTPPPLKPIQDDYTLNISGDNSLSIADPDGDPLNLTLAWGDGQRTRLTLPQAGPNVPVVVQSSHAYRLNSSWYSIWQDAAGLHLPKPHSFTISALLDDGHGHLVWTDPNLTLELTFLPEAGPKDLGIGYEPRRGVGTEAFVLTFTSINFTGSAIEPEGEPLHFSWDFDGDGLVDALGQNVSWMFAAPGTHNVTLWTSDGEWKPRQLYNNSVEVPVRAVDNMVPYLEPPEVGDLATLGRLFGPVVARAVDFDGDILIYTWDLGDGTFLSGASNVSSDPAYWHSHPYEYQPFGWTHIYQRPCSHIVYQILLPWGNTTVVDDPAGNPVVRTLCSFQLKLSVKDEGGHVVTWEGRILASDDNLPPTMLLQVLQFGSVPSGAEDFGDFIAGAPVEFDMQIADPEGDPMALTLEFGDSAVASFENLRNETARIYHTYVVGGKFYSFNITLTDHQVGFFDHNQRISGLRLHVITPGLAIDYIILSLRTICLDGQPSAGRCAALQVELFRAAQAANTGRAVTAIHLLMAFILEVRDLAARGFLTPQEALSLTTAAQHVIIALGG